MNLFDALQETAFVTVTNTMGYDASWQSGQTVYTARVLFSDPTDDKDKVSDQSYTTSNPTVEYKDDDLPGLYDTIHSTNGGQTITVNGNQYNTLTAKKKYDGKTIILEVTEAQ